MQSLWGCHKNHPASCTCCRARTHIFSVLVCLNSGWDLVVENTIMTFQSMQYVQLSFRLYPFSTVFWVWKEDSLDLCQFTKPHWHTDWTHSVSSPLHYRVAIIKYHMATIKCFVLIMYSKGCGAKSVNEARNHVFTTGQKSLDIPHTQPCTSM